MLPVSKTYFPSQTLPHDFGPFPVLPGGQECEGPKLSFHIPRPAAPVLISCFFHIWGTRIQISPQESESSVCLCINIGSMSIPFQIICDSYTQVFYTFKVFQYSALKGVVSLYLTRPFICQLHHVAFDEYSALKGVVSLYLTRPFICQLHHVSFDGLKSHSPFPSPTA